MNKSSLSWKVLSSYILIRINLILSDCYFYLPEVMFILVSKFNLKIVKASLIYKSWFFQMVNLIFKMDFLDSISGVKVSLSY